MLCGSPHISIFFSFAIFREFLRRVSSKGMRDSNAKCEIISDIKNDGSEPVVQVVFSKWGTVCMPCREKKNMDSCLIAVHDFICRVLLLSCHIFSEEKLI